MSTRYNNRDFDRDEEDYGRRRGSEYGRSHGGSAQGRYRFEDRDREDEGYDRERRYRGEFGGRYSPGSTSERSSGSEYGRRYSGREGGYAQGYGGRYSTGRGSRYGGEGYASDRWQDDWGYAGQRDRAYGNYDRTYGEEGRYGERSSSYQPRYNYPTGFRPGERYSEREPGDYGRGQYGRWPERGYESERDYGEGEHRGWWDRTSDEVASWFGDKEAERRRQMDQQREQFRGRGPKGYRRSDERIREDVNDRLSEGYLDASDIEVEVNNGEITLKGSVYSRNDKRLAEDIAESVSGVTNVENRLRVTQSSLDRQSFGTSTALGTTGAETTGTSGSSIGTTPSTGAPAATRTTDTTGASPTPTTGRGKGAGS